MLRITHLFAAMVVGGALLAQPAMARNSRTIEGAVVPRWRVLFVPPSPRIDPGRGDRREHLEGQRELRDALRAEIPSSIDLDEDEIQAVLDEAISSISSIEIPN